MRLRDESLEISRFTKCGGIAVECFAVQAHEHPICAGESALVVLQDGITLVNNSSMIEYLQVDCHTPSCEGELLLETAIFAVGPPQKRTRAFDRP